MTLFVGIQSSESYYHNTLNIEHSHATFQPTVAMQVFGPLDPSLLSALVTNLMEWFHGQV